MTPLRAAQEIRTSEKATLYEIALSTDDGPHTAQVWIPKSQCDTDADGFLCVRTWLIEEKEKEIGNAHPDWGCIEILLAENPNQGMIPGCE